jgi:hypothetical protein
MELLEGRAAQTLPYRTEIQFVEGPLLPLALLVAAYLELEVVQVLAMRV